MVDSLNNKIVTNDAGIDIKNVNFGIFKEDFINLRRILSLWDYSIIIILYGVNKLRKGRAA